MPIIIRNRNYKSPRTIAMETEAAKVKQYFIDHPEIEQLTQSQLVDAVPTLTALAPLEDGEIHYICNLAEVDYIVEES